MDSLTLLDLRYAHTLFRIEIVWEKWVFVQISFALIFQLVCVAGIILWSEKPNVINFLYPLFGTYIICELLYYSVHPLRFVLFLGVICGLLNVWPTGQLPHPGSLVPGDAAPTEGLPCQHGCPSQHCQTPWIWGLQVSQREWQWQTVMQHTSLLIQVSVCNYLSLGYKV